MGCETQIKFGFRIERIHTWLEQKRTAAVLLAWGCGPPLLLHSHANHKYKKQVSQDFSARVT